MRRVHGVAKSGTAATLLLALGLSACGAEVETAPVADEAPSGSVRLSPEQVAAAGVRVDAVHLKSVAVELEVPGTVSSPDTALAEVGSVVEGRVESVAVVPGDRVAAGAALLRIHSHELSDALRDLTAAEARLAYAEAALERSTALLEAGAVAREEEERRRAERDAVAADVARAREWIDHLSPDAVGRVVVRAPRAGTVFEVAARPGSAVTPGAPLVTLGSTEVLWVTGWVPEREGLHLEPGQSVGVRFPSVGEAEVGARIVRMGGAVDPVRRAVEVRAELDGVPAGVRPGSFASLLLPRSAPRLRAVVPAEAVQRTAAGDAVVLEVEPGLYRLAPVSATELPSGRVAVDGLAEGARIVVGGAYAVRSALENAAAPEEVAP